jgi:hypothetical protein
MSYRIALLAASCLLGAFDPAHTAGAPDGIAPPGIGRVAIDTAGKKKMSGILGYIVDTAALKKARIHPSGGLYNQPQPLHFDVPAGEQVYYSFDPIAPPEYFKKYEGAVATPSGINKVRYFAADSVAGRMTPIMEEEFILDTAAPKIYLQVVEGTAADTLKLIMKKRGVIRYTLDGTQPDSGSRFFRMRGGTDSGSGAQLLVIAHSGTGRLNAVAIDESGNRSSPLQWERHYDAEAPQLTLAPPGGHFNQPQTMLITADKPATIFYTLDGSDPREKGIEYPRPGIVISREGTTTIRCRGRSPDGTWSEERSARFDLDTRSPEIRYHLLPTGQEGHYSAVLETTEPATIYYEIGGATPTLKSPVYATPLSLRQGQSFSYFATDLYGNPGKVVVVDDLNRPGIVAVPDGGIFNAPVPVHFKTTIPGVVYCRLLPDSNFTPERDSVVIAAEGENVLEYYVKLMDGAVSAVRRSVFFTDWNPPRVGIGISRKAGDSITILFRCSKNATFYYTTDGSVPLPGRNARVAGDKLHRSQDRITVAATGDCTFSFFAEDVAGNRSTVKTINLSKPQVTSDIPVSGSRPYARMLSITLSSDPGATVHYNRHGKMPSLDAPPCTAPIPLVGSDTIIAIAVDGSGLVGDPDTFVYLIDLPPSAHFTTHPDTLIAGEPVAFDASSSIDKETPLARLRFRWNFGGDGNFTGQATSDPRASHVFGAPGRYSSKLEVTDEQGNTGVFACSLTVLDRCPAGMVSTSTDDGHAVCIDRYEYPNVQGRLPRTSISWVEAKIACIDAGKRLCTRREWESACRNGSGSTYPYGNTYDKNRCPTEGRRAWKTGTFTKCMSGGIADMVGNVWEWVEDKEEDYPFMMGGSYRDGKDANCGLAMPGSLSTRTEDVGFRCCK